MTTAPAATPRDARARILDTAYELFVHRGVHEVGVDEIVARAGVAKATLYRHFPSKNELVLAFLADRERKWTFGLVEAEATRRGSDAEQRLLAIFDVFDEWFQRDDFEACTFITVLLTMYGRGPDDPVGAASVQHLDNIRGVVRGLAQEAGLVEPESFARSWHILMKGSIISASEGDTGAARRALPMARDLIARFRPSGGTSRGARGR